MKIGLSILAIGALAFWALMAFPAWIIGGPRSLLYSAVAFTICLLPSLATLAWGEWAARQRSEQQLLMVLGGTGVRMMTVLGESLMLYLSLPFFQQTSFWLWVLLFYLATLTLEIVLLARRFQARQG